MPLPLFAAALLAAAAAPPPGPIPSEAELRAQWEGGTWKADRFQGGDWMSGFKSSSEYFNPDFVPPNPVPLRPPEALAYRHIREEYGKGHAVFAPYAQCHPAGMPYRLTLNGYGGFQVVVDGEELLILYGGMDFRRIYYRGHAHPDPSAAPTYNGDSIAHWEGPTLVIDTTHIRGENTQIEPHMPKPEGSRIVERYTPDGPGRFAAEMTMTNPRFSRPWVVKWNIVRDPQGVLTEGLCTDENRWTMGAGGLEMNGPNGKPLDKAED